MDYKEYKIMQLVGLGLIGISLLALQITSIPGATIAAIVGVGLFVTGTVGAWFNDS